MRKFLIGAGLLGIVATLASCGGSAACGGVTFSNQCFGLTTAGTLVISNNSASGTGAIIASTPLSGVSTNNSFRLTFSLVDGGVLTLISNATDALGNGVRVEFKRVGSALNVNLKGSGSKDVTSSFAAIAATGEMTLQVDIHNSENPVHFLFWDSANTTFTEPSALLSDETGTPASGTGVYWGLEFSNATVTAVTPSTQKFTE